MIELPAVSCMCLTYGRPHLLEEAVYSFIRQDYVGIKELIILNDMNEQNLIYDHPDVVTVNVNKRFRNVGEKRNACAALCSHDILFVWDDDDIYLPHRISYSVNALGLGDFFKTTKGFQLNNDKLSGPVRNVFHSSSCWSRKWFDGVGGYTHMGSGQDTDIEHKFERIYGKKNSDIPDNDIFYIYRWSGTNSYHLSGFGRDRDGQKTGNSKVQEFVMKQIKTGVISTGNIKLIPKWKYDYTKMTQQFLNCRICDSI